MKKTVACIAMIMMLLGMFGTVHAEVNHFSGTPVMQMPVMGVSWEKSSPEKQ